eukprot:scaffold46667_cov60-Phaeocystis_antarctica.AAC.4
MYSIIRLLLRNRLALRLALLASRRRGGLRPRGAAVLRVLRLRLRRLSSPVYLGQAGREDRVVAGADRGGEPAVHRSETRLAELARDVRAHLALELLGWRRQLRRRRSVEPSVPAVEGDRVCLERLRRQHALDEPGRRRGHLSGLGARRRQGHVVHPRPQPRLPPLCHAHLLPQHHHAREQQVAQPVGPPSVALHVDRHLKARALLCHRDELWLVLVALFNARRVGRGERAVCPGQVLARERHILAARGEELDPHRKPPLRRPSLSAETLARQLSPLAPPLVVHLVVVRVAPPHRNWQPARPVLVVQLAQPAATRHGFVPDGQVGVSAAARVPLHPRQRALRRTDRRREEGAVRVLGEAMAVVVSAQPELKVGPGAVARPRLLQREAQQPEHGEGAPVLRVRVAAVGEVDPREEQRAR